MPNWTYNKIKCKKELGDKILTKDKDNNYVFDFNTLIPMPKSLELVAGSLEDISVASYYLSLSEKKQKELKKVLQNSKVDFYGNYYDKYFHYIKMYQDEPKKLVSEKKTFSESDYKEKYNVKTMEELGKKYIDNITEYEHSQWYEWCIDNWGTKWNVDDEVTVSFDDKSQEYEIEFYTAWDCPRGIMKNIYDLCKENEFDWTYHNEDEEYAHHLSNEDGNFLDEEVEDSREYEEVEI